MRTAERARRAIEVEALATSRVEFMDLLTDRELQALPDSVAKGKFPAPLDEYSWTTTSKPISDPNGLYDIHVTVNWANGSYLVRTYRYITPPTGDSPMTMRARRGMTLMELVIGLAITSMMAAAGAGAFESIIEPPEGDSRRGRFDRARGRASRDDPRLAVDGPGADPAGRRSARTDARRGDDRRSPG